MAHTWLLSGRRRGGAHVQSSEFETSWSRLRASQEVHDEEVRIFKTPLPFFSSGRDPCDPTRRG